MSSERGSSHKKVEDYVRRDLSKLIREREFRHPDGPRFLAAIKAGDLETVKRMIQSNRDLLFVTDDYYGSPVRAAADKHPEIADWLSHVELQRLREGSVPKVWLYGAIHDLGEAAHAQSVYRWCETFRAEAEPVVAGFLAHDDPAIRRIALNVLAIHWDLKHYVQAFQKMGLSDPDEHVRQMAIAVVGWLLRGSRDGDAARFLLGIFHDPAQPAWIRETAYEGLVEIWQGWDAAQALSSRKRRHEESLRAEVGRAGAAGERAQAERLNENAWEDLVDRDFVTQLEKELKHEGRT